MTDTVTPISTEELEAMAAKQRADDRAYAVACARKQLGLSQADAEAHIAGMPAERVAAAVEHGRAGRLLDLRACLTAPETVA